MTASSSSCNVGVHQLDIGGIYAFATKCPEILGVKKKNMVLQGVLNHSMATREDYLKGTVESAMPVVLQKFPSTPKDHEKYSWLLFLSEKDEEYLIPFEFIIEGSLNSKDNINMVLWIDDVTPSQADAIRGAIGKMGIPFEEQMS